jgi:hypothetical protein
MRANESARRCSAFMSARLLVSDLAKADVRELHFAVSPFSLPSLPLSEFMVAASLLTSALMGSPPYSAGMPPGRHGVPASATPHGAIGSGLLSSAAAPPSRPAPHARTHTAAATQASAASSPRPGAGLRRSSFGRSSGVELATIPGSTI